MMSTVLVLMPADQVKLDPACELLGPCLVLAAGEWQIGYWCGESGWRDCECGFRIEPELWAPLPKP
jgi:hypothetical protein